MPLIHQALINILINILMDIFIWSMNIWWIYRLRRKRKGERFRQKCIKWKAFREPKTFRLSRTYIASGIYLKRCALYTMAETEDFASQNFAMLSSARFVSRRLLLVGASGHTARFFLRAFPLIASCATIVPRMKATLAAWQIEFVCDLWPRSAKLRVWLNRLNAAIPENFRSARKVISPINLQFYR